MYIARKNIKKKKLKQTNPCSDPLIQYSLQVKIPCSRWAQSLREAKSKFVTL